MEAAKFMEDDNKIFVVNAVEAAFNKMRIAFAGEADRLGLKDESDVVALVDEIREEMWKELYADNDS